MPVALSKNQLKFIRALAVKKYRQQQQLFIAEGHKLVHELLHSSFVIHSIYAATNMMAYYRTSCLHKNVPLVETSTKDFKRISQLHTPNGVLAIVHIPKTSVVPSQLNHSYALVLDNIQNPGNMGTIIRSADWFGITHIFCSPTCADIYSPKVVQATMGSICRLSVVYTALAPLFKQYAHLPSYGMLLQGKSIFKTNFAKKGFIIIGNEGRGISEDVLPYVKQAITIPSKGKAESLNAAIAAGIVCAIATQ